MEYAIRTQHLTKIYGGRVIAVNDLNLEVPTGTVYGLLGPNGAGKTTTLRLLLGLQRPTAGEAHVFEHRCGVNATGARAAIGYLPTHPSFPGHLRPVEYLDLVGRLHRLPAARRKPRLTSLLRAVGLTGAASQQIHTFSTGMRTRLGIAASLLSDPPLLFWDEPTAGLDPAARRFTLDLIRDLAASHTVVVATHILSDIDQICNHVGVMHEGRMIFSGPMREVRQQLRTDDFRLDLDGRPEAIRTTVEQINLMEGVSAAVRDLHHLIVQVAEGADRAGTLSAVLQLISQHGVSLQSITSGQNETENAYLQLLQEDNAHGFRRFDYQQPAAPDADSSTVRS